MSFQSSGVIETGLSDFHKMTVAVMKASFEILDPKIIHYRDYRKCCKYILNIFWYMYENSGYIYSQKRKYSRVNNMPFLIKSLSRAHMKKTKKLHRTKNEVFHSLMKGHIHWRNPSFFVQCCYLKKRFEQDRLSYVLLNYTSMAKPN